MRFTTLSPADDIGDSAARNAKHATKCADSSRRTFGKIDIECDVLMRVREFCMRNILKWSKTSQTLLRGKRYCDWSACHNEMRQHLPARLSDQIVETIPKDSLRSVVMMNGYILAVAVPPTVEAGSNPAYVLFARAGRRPSVSFVRSARFRIFAQSQALMLGL